mmetsp:Transcript_33657/g.65192  ORF Transcript_33657/g.65192 Transcript_33657/m.65192 type:complete len:156 (-) Transcript_33657:558-1025(-)
MSSTTRIHQRTRNSGQFQKKSRRTKSLVSSLPGCSLAFQGGSLSLRPFWASCFAFGGGKRRARHLKHVHRSVPSKTRTASKKTGRKPKRRTSRFFENVTQAATKTSNMCSTTLRPLSKDLTLERLQCYQQSLHPATLASGASLCWRQVAGWIFLL